MRYSLKKIQLLALIFVLLVTSITYQPPVQAVGIQDCPLPSSYDSDSLILIEQNNIATSIGPNGKYKLNGNYLSNKCGLGTRAVVYGTPANVNDNQFDQGQWRYLGYDVNGTVYRNWLFRSDSRATLHVAKNWVKQPWNEPVGEKKGITDTNYITSHPDAKKWLEAIVDPYKESPTFIQSYNNRTGKGWTGDTLKDYVIIQQVPTDFSPGIIQMWNIWQPDGSWWYEMFYIPPLNPLIIKKQPDLEIDPLVVQSDAWVGDPVPVKITTKNKGQENSGPFTVGIEGTSIKSEVISNVPPGQIKTVTVNVTSATSGIKKFTAVTDFGLAVAESKEDNNKKSFQVAFNKKNEPTTPIAIISHLEGDHRTKPEITIKPATDPMLDDKLSYSPGKEAITLYEWKYKTPSGTTIQKKPVAKDFTPEGEYFVELRVTNSAKKVSEWAQLIINVAEQVTPTPTPAPTPAPRPELRAGIRFVPDKIVAGETSSLVNSSDGFDSFEWTFSANLDPLFTDKSKYEYLDQTFTQAGTYRATIKVSDSSGSATSTATLTVIDPKPIAVVAGATKVVEGRPFPFAYHLNNSYTPLADRGVTIDHSKSEKRYKRAGDVSYTLDFPATNNLALGQYSIEGKVYDTTDRFSDWGELLLDVIPDMPPTIEVIAPKEAYRGNGFMLYLEAGSPDADILEHLFLEERYDSNGNGNFDEEAWTTLYDGAYKTTHSLNYATVGKRQYRAAVTEDYGKTGTSTIASTDVLNYAPSVNFNVFGVTQQPGQGEDSAPPVTSYTTESIFRSWTLKKPYAGGNGNKLGWKVDTTTISTKYGQMVNFNLKYPNAGNGLNSRNKYALASDLVGKHRWKIQPRLPSGYYDTTYGLAADRVFNNNRVYTYNKTPQVSADGSYYEYVHHYVERDAATGAGLRPAFTLESSLAGDLKGDERFYTREIINNNSIKITVHDNTGKKADTHSINLVGVDTRFTSEQIFELMPDFKSVIVGTVQQSNDDHEVKYYKYSLETRTVEWVATGARVSRYAAGGADSYTPRISFVSDGTMFITGKVITKLSPNGSRIDSPVVSGKADGSAISVSNDGNYLYQTNFGYSSGDYKRNYFTTYNANDLSVVSRYTSLPEHSLWENAQSHAFSPIVREDGTVIVVEHGYTYFFSKTGSYLFNTAISYSSNWDKFEGGILSNGDLFDYYYHRLDSQFGLVNISSNTTIMMETTAEFNDYRAGDGFVTVTPVLPNGSVFIFDRKKWPQTVMGFVSSSGNADLQNIDANTVGVFDDNWGGLLYDAGSVMKNYALEFNVSVNDVKNEKMIGAGFHIQNEKNMYAMEWSEDTLTLYKAVNGVKTMLQSVALVRSPFTTYPIKAEAVNGTLRIYVNYAKEIEVTDGTYSNGAAGIMSLGQSSASFSNVKKMNFGDTNTEETYDSVLVNDPISYEKIFNDVENDPMGAEEWSYSHNPNFFENPEGLSIYNGQTLGLTVNKLDKAGVYEISFRAKDNPGLSAYSKWSEPVKKLIYVHRRPIAQPDVRFTGNVFAEGEALEYETYDASYDPDIAHILSDKVFRTRWADESTWTAGKREYYNRPGLELIVQEQVRDIHGTWSYWGEYIVYKEALPPVNQTKPVMTITYPAGASAAAPTVLIKEPALTWTYFDAENDPQEQYRLAITYVDNNETALYIELEGNVLTYPMLEGSIVPGRVVKVEGQVYSAGVWSNWSNSRYFVLDLPPETFLLNFNGPDADNPIYTNANSPQLRVFTVDPENHPITAIDYEVIRAANGVKVVDTNSATAAVSYTTAALAEGLHYWRAKANDGYLWGSYSSNGFLFIDTVKPTDVNEQLDIEPTAVTVRFNAFTDADPSSGHAARSFYLQKVNANGSVSNIDLNGDGSTEYSLPLALDRQSYRVTGLMPGQEYRLTVFDYDIAGNEGHFAYIYFITNRTPTADFDWSPKPVYEGDTATFLSDVSDPDGNTLAVAYELTSPAGVKSSYAYTAIGPSYAVSRPALRMETTGAWSMRMTVSDGIADPVIVTKSVQVLPLQVIGNVKHTDLWDKHRRDYNTDKTGQAESPRGYSVFWAGEKFVLEAVTTVTGTDTRAERVEVQMTGYLTVLDKSNTAQTSWKGEWWDAAFAQLKQGEITITFTAYYNNGTVKTASAQISIAGQTLELVGVHRVQ